MSASFSTGLIGGNFVIGDNRIISISPSSGTNTAGQHLTLQSGQGTGTGTGGSIMFQTAPGGSSGSSANDLATKLTVTVEGIQVAGTGSMTDTLSLTKSEGTGLIVTKNATIGGDLTVTGNLTVSGGSTTITSSTLEVNDKNIVIGNVSGPTNTTADGGGITLKANGDKTIIYTNSGDRWTSNIHWNIASGKEYQINGTAILTSTALNLNDTSNVLTSTALGSTVVASSLTSVGTIGTGVWNATPIADGYISSANTWTDKQDALTFGKSSGNALKSEEALVTNNVLLMGTTNVKGRTYSELKTDLSLNSVENTALSTWSGTTNITTVGTIGTGTWNATTIAIAKGGTGQTTYTDGQLLIGNSSNGLTKSTLTAGSNVTVTNGNGSITIASTDTNTTYTGGTGITLSSTTFNLDTASASALGGVKVGTGLAIDGSGVLSSTSSGKWSGTTDIYYNSGDVGIGTTTPDKPLHVKHGGGTAIRIETTQGDADNASNMIEWYDSAGQKAFVGDGSGGNKTFYIYNNRGHVFLGGSNTTNVGIGEASPSYKLDVNGTGRFTDTLSLTRSDGTGLIVTKNATIGGNLTVTGNLTVSGTTTTVNSTTVTVDDPIITLGGDTAPGSDDNKDRGVEFRYYDGSAKVGFMGWDNDASNRCFVLLKDATNSSEVFSGTAAELKVGSLTIGSDTVSNLSSLLTTISPLSSLSNVHTATPSDNQVLTWDGTNDRWEPANASGGGASALNDLTDVSTSGAQSNYALVYNGSSWAPAAQSGSGGGSAGTVSANVVHQRMTDITTISITGSGGKTEIEGLRLTITPQSSSSKVELNYNIFHEANNWNYGFLVSRTVGGTETFFRIADATNDLTFSASYHDEYSSLPQTTSYSMIDEPNTAGAVVYKVYGAATHTTAITLYINRTKNDGSETGQEHGISTSSVKEFSNFTHNIAEQKVQGRVLETIAGVCDGRSVSGSSGTYTLENVDASFEVANSSWDKMTGSGINYKPPPGAKQVIFKIDYSFKGSGSGTKEPLFHTKLKVGNSYVENQEHCWRTSVGYIERVVTDKFIIDIGNVSSDDITNGKLSNWDTNRQLQVDVRAWSGYGTRMHALRHDDGTGDGTSSGYFRAPKLEIQAIGEENLVYNLTNQYSITEGQTLETLAGVCDGRSVTVSSGTYALPNVTAVFEPSDGSSYVDLPNSSFSYKPPPGTRQVIYRYKINIAGNDTHGIANFKLYVDDTEVTKLIRSWTGKGPDEDTLILDYTFEIGKTDDVANAKFLTWNTLKTIKIKVREHTASGHEVKFYSRGYWEGSYQYGSDGFVQPSLEITAIGRGVIEGNISNLYSSKVNMEKTTYSTQTTLTAPSSLPGVNVSGLNLSIKPTAADSVIELKFNLWYESFCDAVFRITRNIDGTDVLVTSATNIWEGGVDIPKHDADTDSTPEVAKIRWYDEPNTTSTVTYKLWVNSSHTGTSKTIYVNRSEENTGASQYESGVSTAIAIEHPQQTVMHNPRYNSVIEQEGQTLETLAGVCDGRSITVSSGTYTLPNISQVQALTTTFTDASGSVISYKPPPGTRQVIYKFTFTLGGDNDSHALSHHKLLVDNTEITNFRTDENGYYSVGQRTYVYVFEIGTSDSASEGKFSSWNTLKTIKIQSKDYSTSHDTNFHQTRYWDSTSPNFVFSIPKLEIQAIGRKSDTTFLNSFFNERKGQVLETLSGHADGSTVTVSSGTYTMPTALADGTLVSTSYMKETASEITYKAPPGTERIIFEFIGIFYYQDADATLEGEFYVDDVKYPGSGSRGHFKVRQGRSPNGEIPFPQMIITTSQYDLTVSHKYYWKMKSYSSGHELRTGYVSSSDAGLYPTAGQQFLKIQAIGDAAIQNATVVAGNSMVHFQGFSDTFTVTNSIHYITGYENAPTSGSGYGTGLPLLKNFGNAMNTSTGIFTAPHTGLYSINVVVHKHENTTYGNVYLVIGDKSTAFGDIKENYDNTGASAVYHIDSGTEVYLKSQSGAYPTSVNLSITALQDQVPQAISSRPGMTLETLAGVCDGRSITVSSGTYTLDNVDDTTRLSSTTTWVDIPGSTLNYKPPPGTKQVLYNFNFQYGAYDAAGALFTMKIEIDGVEIPKSYMQIEDSRGGTADFQYVIDIGNVSSDDMSIGKLASWDSYRTLNVSMCLYHTLYDTDIHGLRYGNVSSSGQGSSGQDMRFHGPPRLEVKAIGDGPGIVPSTGMNVVTANFSTGQSINIPHALPGYHVSELDLVITPTATDSIIELKFNLFVEFGHNICFRIKRNDDFVIPATEDGDGALSVSVHDNTDTTKSTPFTHTVRWYDQPNTTSTITYKLYLNVSQGALNNEAAWINRTKTTTADYDENGASTAIAIEYPKTARPLDTENALTIPPFVGATNKEKLYNQSGDLYFNGKQLSNEWYKNGGDLYRLGANVGIGKSSPAYKLDVTGDINFTGNLRQNGSAYIGIGTTSPSVPFEVAMQVDVGAPGTISYLSPDSPGANGHTLLNSSHSSRFVSIKSQGTIWAGGWILAGSDRRIKENIEDVNSIQALTMLRNIPCRYYEYLDKIKRGSGKVIGFIAQEVKSVLPMAIDIQTEIIPNVYKIISCEWKGNVMYSQELGIVSGVKYKFYVGNTDKDETERVVTGNSDNTFTFEQQWNNVFCYGKEIDDFHTIDKQKLCALNFSATQELDRQQQADKAKIASLETKVASLESELATIKAHLGL